MYPVNCGHIVLCQKAKTRLFAERVWGLQEYKFLAIKEAKKRGLSCNVGSDYLDQLNLINIRAVPVYNQKCEIEKDQIKQAQSYLKQLKLYNYAIDGIIGIEVSPE